MFTESQGKCIDCGGPTGSGALQLCPKCSAKRHQCEHCLAKLTAKEESAAETAPPAPLPGPALEGDAESHSSPPVAVPGESHGSNNASRSDIPSAVPPGWSVPDGPEKHAISGGTTQAFPPVDPNELLPPPNAAHAGDMKYKPIDPCASGAYTAGKWRFQLQIVEPGTRNEGRWGWLTYDGQKLPRGNVNDYYVTPWGPMYWVDVPKTAWGLHGFMPVPLPQNRQQGRALTLPARLTAGTSTPNGTAPGIASSAPAAKVQTLEINRSHNGQVARLHVGNVLIVRLPGNPASGYQWQAGTTNTQAVRMTVRPQYSPPAATPTGAAATGIYTFVFQAVQPGAGISVSIMSRQRC